MAPQKTACLTALPVEILLEIYQQLDIDSIFELSATNQFYLSFFEHRRATILLQALQRNFEPFDELLQIYTASENDINSREGLYKPRGVVFKRFVDDTGIVLARPPPPQLAHCSGKRDDFFHIVNVRRPSSTTAINPRPIILTDKDLDPVLRMCRVVRKWEDLFPQMRWFHRPAMCRFLRHHEKLRFRRALYRWWLYDVYFHGELPRPRMAHPEPAVADIRTSQMRYHCTGELLELMDLLETVKDLIFYYICPKLDENLSLDIDHTQRSTEGPSRKLSLATSWTDQSVWGRIVKTYMKLGPRDLLYYFDNIYSYPRERLINKIRLENPSFTVDQASIQVAVRCALDERRWLDQGPSLADDIGGGIIDFDDERDGERAGLRGDGSVDGSLPGGSPFIQTQSRYSPRGDDGSCLESRGRPSRQDVRLFVSTAIA